jgi:hypothetical protein
VKINAAQNPDYLDASLPQPNYLSVVAGSSVLNHFNQNNTAVAAAQSSPSVTVNLSLPDTSTLNYQQNPNAIVSNTIQTYGVTGKAIS